MNHQRRIDGQRRAWLRASLGLGAGALAGAFRSDDTSTHDRAGPRAGLRAGADRLQWQERVLLGFGTALSLRAAHAHAGVVSQALDDAVAEIRAIESQMSLFDPDSALCRLNREGCLVDPDWRLVEVLTLAQQVARASDGAFDVTMQPLWRVWSDASRLGRPATQDEIARARASVDWRKLELADHAVRLLAPGMAVSLNGIAQGYAADRARAVLQRRGIEHALLDTGEWAPLGRPAPASPWQLGIADPHQRDALIATLATDGRCVCTSSDDRTAFSADRRDHHIVDPRVGCSPLRLSGVTVVAESGALADALTKVFFMAETRLGGAAAADVTARAGATAHAGARARAGVAPRFDPALASIAASIAQSWNVDALLIDKQGAWWASDGLRLSAPV